jgi:hypothetical protein
MAQQPYMGLGLLFPKLRGLCAFAAVRDRLTGRAILLNPDVTTRAIWQSVRRLGWEMASEFCLRALLFGSSGYRNFCRLQGPNNTTTWNRCRFDKHKEMRIPKKMGAEIFARIKMHWYLSIYLKQFHIQYMEAEHSFETSVWTHYATRCENTEDNLI